MKSRLARIDPMQRVSGAHATRFGRAVVASVSRVYASSQSGWRQQAHLRDVSCSRKVVDLSLLRADVSRHGCHSNQPEHAQSPFQRLFKLELHSPASCCNYDDAPRIGRMYKAHTLRCQSYRSLLGAPELDTQIHPPTNFLSRSAVRLTADTRLNQ